jgi:hypothetical protein
MGSRTIGRPVWSLRPFERVADDLEATARELEGWALDNTTPEQSVRLREVATTLRAAAQDVVESLGDGLNRTRS